MFISIVIPTYNRQGPLLRAIDSVLRQTHQDFELIVVDDGSRDNTAWWLGGYADRRVRYFQVSHGGVAAARNFGARQAQSDWLCFLDSDDLWGPTKLAKQVAFHKDHKELLISQTDDVWIRNGRRVNKMRKHALRGGGSFSPKSGFVPDLLFLCDDQGLFVLASGWV